MTRQLESQPALKVIHGFLDTLEAGYQAQDYLDYYQLVHSQGVPEALATVIETAPEQVADDALYSRYTSWLRRRVGDMLLSADVDRYIGRVQLERQTRGLAWGVHEVVTFKQSGRSLGDEALVRRRFLLGQVACYRPQGYGWNEVEREEINGFLAVAGRAVATLVQSIEG